MKLYFAPAACSLSPHIVLREVGASFDLEQVYNRQKKTKSGADFWTINPKGYVPVLELDAGARLTEGPAIVQYIADMNPAAGLSARCGPCSKAFVTPTTDNEPTWVCELAGMPKAQVPRFQKIAAISSAQTMANPARCRFAGSAPTRQTTIEGLLRRAAVREV